MTSNVGARLLNKRGDMGFAPAQRDEEESEAAEYRRVTELVMPQVRELFKPEFLNRVDDVVTFHALSRAQVRTILDIMLGQTTARLSEQLIELEVTEAAKDVLADRGYDREYGARPLRRAVQTLLEDRLAEALLEGAIKSGDRVRADRGPDDAIELRFIGVTLPAHGGGAPGPRLLGEPG